MVNNVFTFVPEPSTLIKYNMEGKIEALIGETIIQVGGNIEKMIPLNGNILIVTKDGLGELVL